MAYRWLENLHFIRSEEAGKWILLEGVGYTTYSEGGFFEFDIELGERERDFTVEIDGENIIVDGYSMPVKEDREFTFSCKKSFIKAIHGAEGLYKFIDEEKSGAMECYVRNIVNWVLVYGKKEIQEKEGATA
jgi:hypothetical protein